MWRAGVNIGITILVLAIAYKVQTAAADNADTGANFNLRGTSVIESTELVVEPQGHAGPVDLNASIFSLSFGALSLIANSAQSSVNDRLATFKTAAATSAHRTTGGLSSVSNKAIMTMPSDSFSAFGSGGWTQLFGLTSPRAHIDPTVEQDTFSGAMIGFDTKLSDHMIGGLFFGGSTGKLSTENRANKVSANGFYGGFYVTRLWGRNIFDLTASAGLTEQNTERLVSDANQNARASYSGYFFNPTLTASHFTTIAGQLIVPSLKLAYSGYIFEDFKESGSVENLSVSAHSTHMMSARAQLAVPLEEIFFDTASFKFEGRGGVRTKLNLSGDNISTVHQDHELLFTTAEHAYTLDVFIGADAVYRLANGILLFGEFETAIESTGDINAQALFGTRFSF